METIGSLWSLWVTIFPHTLGMNFIQIITHEECNIIEGRCGVTLTIMNQLIQIRRGEKIPLKRKRIKIQCVPLGRRFHALNDN